MQGTRWRSIVVGAGVAATVTMAGCGRSGTSAPVRAERPTSDAVGCGDRRDGARIVAAAPRVALTPIDAIVTPLVLPGGVALAPCGARQVFPGAIGADPSCLDLRAVPREPVLPLVTRRCRPTGPGVDDDANGHPGAMSDTPPTKPLPDLPDEPVPTPMPKDPPTPQPGQPSG